MGSGDKIQFSITNGFGLAVYFSKFPHEYCATILIGCFNIYIGFGKGYEERL